MGSPSSHYESIIEPIEDRMIRTVWRITRNAQDAEDAMQDALVILWRRWHRMSRHANPQALALRVCIDAAWSVVRGRERRRAKFGRDEPTDPPADHARLPWEELAHQELTSAILAAVARLSRGQANAFTLRVFEELPYEQIGAAMGCSEATARKHVECASDHLRAVLAKHDPDRLTRR
jgi:RNA polymerase sigma factor (sigma-70 family)